jgi:molecular chaperone GrpE
VPEPTTPAEELEQTPRGADPEAAEELERAKERIARQAERETEHSRRELIGSFLEVLDDLERALEAAGAAGDEDEVRRGVEMVRDRFLSKLAQHGVLPADDLGKPFDPERHEALTAVTVDDPADRGRVMGVLKSGYTIDGELLRPAGVAVGR